MYCMGMDKYHRLNLVERETISNGIYSSESCRQIAEKLNRNPSTINREIRRDVKRKNWSYSAVRSQSRADLEKRKHRQKKIEASQYLKEYVYARLKERWSPEEIAKRLKLEYSQDTSMRISHESIYQHLYCLPKGELKKELMRGLRREQKQRLSRGARYYRRQRIQDIVSISERPKEAKNRIVPGHWEGDLIMGKNHASALGTLVERTTRLTLLVPLTAKDAFGVRNAFAEAFQKIPAKFKKSLTYDRGSEMKQHKLFTEETRIKVFFADPYSPWQRGTNENTNGLIRQYFPKGTDFKKISLLEIKRAEMQLNSRPRKILQYYTPSERFYELIAKRKIALEN